MVKSILLKFDEEFFYKMKEHKLDLESTLNKKLNWERYIQLLTGFTK